jgi:acyl carrier protein
MNKTMINPSLKEILLDLGFSEDELTENTLIRKDLQLDSTETVDISLGIKRRIGASIKLESRQDQTLAQVSELIDRAILQLSSFQESPTTKSQTADVIK